jgi:hypothetical protein
MTEDYQNDLDALGKELQDMSYPEGSDTNESATVEEDTSKETETETEVTESKDDVETEANKTFENQKANEAFASMRAENSKYKSFLKQLMKGSGFQGDEATYMQNLIDASYKQQSERQGQGVSPEFLKKMDDLENKTRVLEEERNRTAFAANIRGLQDKFKLSDSEIKEFLDTAVQEHIDITAPGSNFVTLYQGLFYDKLIEKKIKEERQQWIAQNSKANSAANVDNKSGKVPEEKSINNMAEFESLLRNLK